MIASDHEKSVRRWCFAFLLPLLLTSVGACGEDGADPSLHQGDGRPGRDASSQNDTVPIKPPPQVDIDDVSEQLLSIPSVEATIKAWVYTPPGCDADDPCLGLVLVPDLRIAGTEQYPADLAKGLAVLTDTVVAVYNPPGFGEGAAQSSGERDFGGPRDQDALKDVLGRLEDFPGIEADHMGCSRTAPAW